MNRQMLSLNTHTVQHVDLCVMDNAATRETLVCLCLVMSNSTLSCIKQLLMPVTSGSSSKMLCKVAPKCVLVYVTCRKHIVPTRPDILPPLRRNGKAKMPRCCSAVNSMPGLQRSQTS